ncbi:MAG: hypothetical protein FD147_1649 [Chloroflexi bacterium]|nr:MAG: hypothetical protein FD147_1649 [Chloroflexota bacterium]
MNLTKSGRLITWLLILLAISLFLAGCSGARSYRNAAASGKTYEVSPGFREFYNSLGGEVILGPAISQNFNYQSYECQYTANALMCLNPVVLGAGRFGLFPLGTALNVREDPSENASNSGSRVVNGYTIYEEFVTLYDQLSGVVYTGNPLTQVHLNYPQQRIEQFFENVGLYRKFSDPPGTVRLLAYGAASCTKECNYHPALEAMILDSSNTISDQSLLEGLGKVGNSSVFGQPLTQPYLAMDGKQEQVYENVVLYTEGNSGTVKLRPLSILLNMLTMEPGEKVYGNQNGVVFYSVKDGLGYHVPIVFDEFISAHGGTILSGDPIADVIEYQSGIYRQCFTNYCLDYAPSAPEDQRVTIAPLGSLYLEQMQKSVTLQQPTVISPDTVALQLSEQYKQLPSTEPQKIDLFVYRKEDQQPLAGFESYLQLNLPDGSTYNSVLPVTQSDGRSTVIIPSMKNIPNGSILTYQVCLKSASTQPICAAGSYLVWKIP